MKLKPLFVARPFLSFVAACIACVSSTTAGIYDPIQGYLGHQTAMMATDANVALANPLVFNTTSGWFGTGLGSQTVYTNANVLINSLRLSDGHTGSSATFTGKVTGSGDVVNAATSDGGSTVDLVFSGDVSTYSGNFSFLNRAGRTNTIANGIDGSILQFGGQAAGGTVAQGAISTSGGELFIDQVSGSGSITANNLVFNYAADASYDYLRVTNPLLVRYGLFVSGTADLVLAGDVTGGARLEKLGSGSLTVTGSMNLTGGARLEGASLIVDSAADNLLTGVITGSGGIVQAGQGSLILNGASDYTGTTEVTAGRLVTNGTLTSDITVATGAQFGGVGSTTGALTLADGATFLLGETAFTADGGVTLGQNIDVGFSAAPSDGTITLLNYGSGLIGDVAELSSSEARVAFADDPGNQQILATITTRNNIWNTNSGVWDVGNSAVWSNGADQLFYAGDSVVFNNPAVNSTVTLHGSLIPSSVRFDHSNQFVLSGSGGIDGTAGLEKSGSGRLTIQTVNDFSGPITIAGGVLELSGSGELGRGNYGGNIENHSSFEFRGDADQTLAGIISGSGALLKAGSGTLRLNGANTFTGKVLINSGVLEGAFGNSFGGVAEAPEADKITINGGTLATSGANQTLAASHGILIGASGATIDSRVIGVGPNATIASPISGTGSLTLNANGTFIVTGTGQAGSLTLSNPNNTFVGDVRITSGVVAYAGDGSFGAPSNQIILDGGGLVDKNTNVPLSRDIVIGPAGGTFRTFNATNTTWTSSISGSGNVSRTDGGTLTLAGDLQNFSGTFTNQAGNTILRPASGTIGGNWLLAAGGMTLDSAANHQIAGSVNQGTFIKQGAGSLSLSGTNNSSHFDVRKGTLVLAHPTDTLAANAAVTVSTGGTLDIGTNSDAMGTLTLNGGKVVATSGSLSPISVVANSGEISATLAGSLAFTKSSPGSVVISGLQTYTGLTKILGGRVDLDGTLVNSNVTLDGGALAGNGTVNGSLTLTSGRLVLDAADPSGGLTVGGAISNSPVALELEGLASVGTTTYTVLNYDNFAMVNDLTHAFRSPGVVNDTINKRLTIAITTANRTWSAAQDNIWDHETNNWLEDDQQFFGGDYAIFSDAGAGTVVIDGSISPGVATFSNTVGNDYLITGGTINSGNIVVNGGGKVVIAANNASAGSTSITNGILQIGNGGTSGTLASGVVTNEGTLIFDRSNPLTVASSITGNGEIIKRGDTVIFTGENSFTGTTTISAGRLQIGNGGTTGTMGTGAIVNDGTFAVNRSDASTVSADLSGTGSLLKEGAGTLTYAGNSTQSGWISIDDGTLAVSGTISGATSLATNGNILEVKNGGDVAIAGLLSVARNTNNRLVVDPGGRLSATTLAMSWDAGRGFVVNGELDIAETMSISTNANTVLSGNGQINVGEISLFNHVRFFYDNAGTMTVAGKVILGGPTAGGHNSTLTLQQGRILADGLQLGRSSPVSTGLQTANLVSGRLDLGVSGIESMAGANTRLNLGDVTLGGTSDWELLSRASLTGTTVFDTTHPETQQALTISIWGEVDGDGSISVIGAGELVIDEPTRYTGDTTVEASLLLDEVGELTFFPTANGVSNRVTGTGSANFNGYFVIDLSNAAVADGNVWTLVDVANSSYGGIFIVKTEGDVEFATSGGIEHTLVDGGNTWTFNTITGTLSLESSASTDPYLAWAAQINDPAQRDRGDDPDGDGLTNEQEYLFGGDPNAADGSLIASVRNGNSITLRWLQLNSGASYRLEESSTLQNPWTVSTTLATTDPDQSGAAAGYTRMRAEVPLDSPRNFFRVMADETP